MKKFILKHKIGIGACVLMGLFSLGYWVIANPGTTSIGEDIDVAGNLTVNGITTLSGNQYPTTTGSDGQVLKTNGAGSLGWGPGVPSGLIAMFDTSCPSGWTRVTALDGKFLVGGASYNAAAGGSDSITLAEANLPSHTHSVDPPSTASGSQSVGHTHGMTHTHSVDPPSTASGSQSASHTHGMTHTHSINPPSTGTNSTGAHTHTYINPQYTRWSAGGSEQWSVRTNYTRNTSSAGSHAHSVDIGAFTSGGSSAGSTGSQSASHTHTTNIAAFTSGGSSAGSTGSQSASHTHTTDIGSFTSGATGSGTSFDNRPAYATIVICKKD